MSVFTLVMTVDVEAVSFAGYFYFHTDINVGDLIDVEMEKAPGGVFNGRVTEAYSLGMKDDAAEVPPCRLVVVAPASPALFVHFEAPYAAVPRPFGRASTYKRSHNFIARAPAHELVCIPIK